MASKTYLHSKELKKLVIGFTLAISEWYGNFGPYSKAELRSYLDAAWRLFLLDPNLERFLDKLHQFFYELEEQRKPPFQIGRYISKHLKNTATNQHERFRTA